MAADERGHCPEVRHVAGREHQRARQLNEACEGRFEAVVGRRVAEYQMRRAGADSVRACAGACGRYQPRIGGQTQIVIAAKCDIVAAVDDDTRALRALQHAAMAPQAACLQRNEISGEIVEEHAPNTESLGKCTGVHATPPPARAVSYPASPAAGRATDTSRVSRATRDRARLRDYRWSGVCRHKKWNLRRPRNRAPGCLPTFPGARRTGAPSLWAS